MEDFVGGLVAPFAISLAIHMSLVGWTGWKYFTGWWCFVSGGTAVCNFIPVWWSNGVMYSWGAITGAGIAFAIWWWDDGDRRKALRQLGAKARARIQAMTERLRQAPAPRPRPRLAPQS